MAKIFGPKAKMNQLKLKMNQLHMMAHTNLDLKQHIKHNIKSMEPKYEGANHAKYPALKAWNPNMKVHMQANLKRI